MLVRHGSSFEVACEDGKWVRRGSMTYGMPILSSMMKKMGLNPGEECYRCEKKSLTFWKRKSGLHKHFKFCDKCFLKEGRITKEELAFVKTMEALE